MTIRHEILEFLRRRGIDVRRIRPMDCEFSRLVRACVDRRLDVMLDVGANVGQFAKSFRRNGFAGEIISFEPLSSAYERLVVAASADPHWMVAPQCAVGEAEGTTTMHRARNSVSSSLLPMLDRHIRCAPASAYVGEENVRVVTLGGFIEQSLGRMRPIGLKIDAQGYEHRVLMGLSGFAHRVEVLFTEMSLAAVYAGAEPFEALFARIRQLGLSCISITPGFTDPANYEVLQVNAIFAKPQERAA
jgi:FkbM family methyltransferase